LVDTGGPTLRLLFIRKEVTLMAKRKKKSATKKATKKRRKKRK
jgi:2-keto-3-deoxy-galactonokinase